MTVGMDTAKSRIRGNQEVFAIFRDSPGVFTYAAFLCRNHSVFCITNNKLGSKRSPWYDKF